MTQGASMRSHPRPPTKVSVRPRPCGTLATSRVPLAHRPYRRVMLVLAQVSSMKTRRLGSMRPWYFFHCARRRATSGRSCSAACRLFFERHFLGLQEVPDRLAAHPDAAGCKLGLDAAQRQIRLHGQPPQQPVALTREHERPIPPPHRLARRAPRRPVALRPPHNARNADYELPRRLTATLAAFDRRHHPFAQIKRIRSRHPYWPPYLQPAS